MVTSPSNNIYAAIRYTLHRSLLKRAELGLYGTSVYKPRFREMGQEDSAPSFIHM